MAVKRITVDGVEYPIAPMEPPAHKIPTSGFYAFPPHVAQAWLNYNYNNRNMRKRGIADYGRDMASGGFLVTGDTIKVSRPCLQGEHPLVPEGRMLLIDGQHRLETCVATGTPFVTNVATGLAPHVQAVVDSGMKRSIPDMLRMEGEAHVTVLASVVRLAWMWERGDRRFGGATPTKQETAAFLEKYPDELRRGAHYARYVRMEFPLPPQSVVGMAWWLLSPIDPSLAPEFFDRLRDGAELKTTDPVFVLRRRFTVDKRDGKRATQAQRLGYIVRAWNAQREDRELTNIQQPASEPVPEPR